MISKVLQFRHPVKPNDRRMLQEYVAQLSFNTLDKSAVDLFLDAGDVYVYWNVPPFGYAVISSSFLIPPDTIRKMFSNVGALHVELSSAYPGRTYNFIHGVFTCSAQCIFQLFKSRDSKPSVSVECYIRNIVHPWDYVTTSPPAYPHERPFLHEYIPSADTETVNKMWSVYANYVMRYFSYRIKIAKLYREVDFSGILGTS